MKSTKVTSYKLPLIILSCLLAITIGVLIAIWIPYSTGQRSEEKYESTGFAMGTYMQQTLFGGTESDRTDTAVNATKAVSDLQSHISWRETDSDIQNLNNHAGEQRVSIHEDTASVLNISLEVARRTNGAYDPTILPLSLLWNFDEGANKVPEKAAIKEHLQYVGYSALQVDSEGNTAFLSEKTALWIWVRSARVLPAMPLFRFIVSLILQVVLLPLAAASVFMAKKQMALSGTLGFVTQTVKIPALLWGRSPSRKDLFLPPVHTSEPLQKTASCIITF